jgi:hypothetical protein
MECDICFSVLGGKACVDLTCGHSFHAECAAGLKSFGISNACPTCGAEVTFGGGLSPFRVTPLGSLQAKGAVSGTDFTVSVPDDVALADMMKVMLRADLRASQCRKGMPNIQLLAPESPAAYSSPVCTQEASFKSATFQNSFSSMSVDKGGTLPVLPGVEPELLHGGISPAINNAGKVILLPSIQTIQSMPRYSWLTLIAEPLIVAFAVALVVGDEVKR